MIDAVAESFGARYPEMFKPSQRCRPPHLNLDVFRDDLFQSRLIPLLGLRSLAQLEAYLQRANEQLSQRSEEQWRVVLAGEGGRAGGGKATDQALRKAREHGFFLGMTKAWMVVPENSSNPVPDPVPVPVCASDPAVCASDPAVAAAVA